MSLEPTAEERVDVLRARIAELGGKLAEAEADATGAWSVIAWLARQDTFSPGGEYVQVARRAEDARPAVAQALLRLVEAAKRFSLATHCRAAALQSPAGSQKRLDLDWGELPLAEIDLHSAVDALQAARAGRGEGE